MVPAKIAWLHGLGFRNGVSGLRAIDRVSNVLPDLLLLEFAKFCQRGHPLRTPTMSRKMVCKDAFGMGALSTYPVSPVIGK